MADPGNQVLEDGARKSGNFHGSDRILRHHLDRQLDDAALEYMADRLDTLGKAAATRMDALSLRADRNPPRLVKRSPLGETVDRVDFDPSYFELLDIAARSHMIHLKYEPDLRTVFAGYRQRMGFAAGQLYAMSEIGVYCPLCMTDGAALLLERFGDADDRRLVSGLAAATGADLLTGAMFLTEKTAGSDVAAFRAVAHREKAELYRLDGEKWFCSNVNADVILTLARTGGIDDGIDGLSLFLVESRLASGRRNPMDIVRLKDKMGVRSMATGEVIFTGTAGKLIGDEGDGFRQMAAMINLSRIYNSVAALGGSRRALIEAWQYLNHRMTFGARAVEHAQVRGRLHELGALYVANFHLLWRALEAMDAADSGDDNERSLLRMLTPLCKWWIAEQGVYIARECMELLGGNGYIEDFVLPKVFRDMNALPIWEGASNIIILDVLRAAEKSDALEQMLGMAADQAGTSDAYGPVLHKALESVRADREKLSGADRDVMEACARNLFARVIRIYQMALLLRHRDEVSAAWIDPALSFLAAALDPEKIIERPLDVGQLEGLMGWDY